MRLNYVVEQAVTLYKHPMSKLYARSTQQANPLTGSQRPARAAHEPKTSEVFETSEV
ncbi:MAG: hypothetical protein WA821_23070 [Anaerolineales bacterium]